MKNTAILVVNPVNGLGLFQYLEGFFENSIPFKTFAVADAAQVKTNSGAVVQTDDVVANLKGRSSGYDALVFACGDAMPKFAENAGKSYNQDMLAVLSEFANSKKIIIGHCAMGLLLDGIPALKGKRLAVHPMAKPMLKNCIGTDEKIVVDGNLYTAQDECSIWQIMPQVVQALK